MPARGPLEVRRHYGELSERETDEVVGIVADLIVAYLKKRDRAAGPVSAANANDTTDTHEVQA